MSVDPICALQTLAEKRNADQANIGDCNMQKTITRGVFYGVATVLLLWTASLTYSFVQRVLPDAHWLVPVFALVVFDVGAVAWLLVFLNHAEGTGQRATALIMCAFDFLGVGLMVLAEVFLGGQSFAAAPANLGELAVWGIAIWTVINVGAVLVFHLLSPVARSKMALQTEKDAIFNESLERLKGKRAAVSGRVSDAMADDMLQALLADLASDNPGREATPATAAVKPQEVTFSVNQNGEPSPKVIKREG